MFASPTLVSPFPDTRHPSSCLFVYCASPTGFPAIAMKSAIICEQWKFEYSAPPSRRGRGLPTTPGRVKTSPRQRQPCPGARINPAPGLKPRCPAGLIGLTDHRSADRYRHPSRQSRAPFHHFHVPYHPHPTILSLEVILHT